MFEGHLPQLFGQELLRDVKAGADRVQHVHLGLAVDVGTEQASPRIRSTYSTATPGRPPPSGPPRRLGGWDCGLITA